MTRRSRNLYMRKYRKTERYKAYHRAYMREWQRGERQKAYMQEWHRNNWQEYKNAWGRRYYSLPSTKAMVARKAKTKRRGSISIRVKQNTSRRIRRAIRSKKSFRTLVYLGCTIARYIRYLEGKFQAGMTWENYGSAWVIDHIKPCASFDLEQERERIKCFHYKNTQPLCRVANLKKGKKYYE